MAEESNETLTNYHSKLKQNVLENKYILVYGIPNKRKRMIDESPSDVSPTKVFKSTEVQSHGFGWEKEILQLYGATVEELNDIPYTSKVDLPYYLNRLNMCDISVKTTKSSNTVCMADCLRLFDAINMSTNPIHLVVIIYNQNTPNTKKISNIIEVDLTNSRELLFGTLNRGQLLELDTLVKRVPQNRKPTNEEHTQMYNIRTQLQELSGSIYLNIKCNSQQSRLQCSFNHFQQFITNNPTRIIATSNNNEFHGGMISSSIISTPRKFNKKIETI